MPRKQRRYTRKWNSRCSHKRSFVKRVVKRLGMTRKFNALVREYKSKCVPTYQATYMALQEIGDELRMKEMAECPFEFEEDDG